MLNASTLMRGVSLVSGIGSYFQIAAVGVAVLGVFGFGYAGCQSLINAGYQKAEAQRLEELVEHNADTSAKLRKDIVATKAAEARYRKERDRARATLRARDADGVKKEGSRICAPGCVISR